MSNRYRTAIPAKKWTDILLALIFAVLTIAGIGLSGCRKQAADLTHYQPLGNTKSDTLRMFNMLADSSLSYTASSYVLYVNDSMNGFLGRGLFQRGVLYAIPPSLPVSAQGGTFNLKVAAYTFKVDTPPLKHPDVSRVLCQTTISLPPHSGFGNVFIYDSAGKPAIRYMPVTTADPGAPAPGTFKVRVINFGYELQDLGLYPTSGLNSAGKKFDLQLRFADSSVVAGNEKIAFSGVGPYRQFDYGTWQFLLYNLTADSCINNSGPLNDIGGSFDLTTAILSFYQNDPASNVYNYAYPNYTSVPQNGGTRPTLHLANIGSYQFSAGCCYTILVVGNMYTVTLDRQYGSGDLDNFAKVQLVNAAPGQTDLQVTIAAGGRTTQIASLPFGSYAEPVVVPAGDVTCTFSAHGQTLYTYSTQVPRLANYLLCYSTDLKQLPFVFPQVVTLTPLDYTFPGQDIPAMFQLTKVSVLNLSPDAGTLYFTNNLPLLQNGETATNGGELPYKAGATLAIQDGFQPATQYNIRLSSKRTDSLANQMVASLPQPFPVLPAPGTYTLVAAGLLDAADTSQALRIIRVKHTNFIPKAQ